MNRNTVPIITDEEHKCLLNWILSIDKERMIFNSNNEGYFFNCEVMQENASKKINNLIRDIKNRIIFAEKLNKTHIESPIELEDFIYIMPPGTKLHKHKDVNITGMYHIRFNLLLQKAEVGGICVYGGKKVLCKEKCYVLCRSGIDLHGSTQVEGNKPRIVISYGFNIPIDTINEYPDIFYGTISRTLKFMDNNNLREGERYSNHF
jgi:hypothetical protein